jgi:uncharacterized membrane protein YqaE (UPF0057 family)
MKKLVLFFACMVFALSVFAESKDNWKAELNTNPAFAEFSVLTSTLTVDEFLNLTPKMYREYTGEKLGIKNTVKLKAAQKWVKKHTQDSDLSKGVYILLAFLGLGWLAMGLASDWDGSDWIVNLVLTLLCWLPGFIHALVKMDDYY